MIALDLSAEEATKFLKMRRGRASDHCFSDQLTVCFTLYRDTNRVIQVKQTAPAFVANSFTPARRLPPSAERSGSSWHRQLAQAQRR
jgi:hypothetical protein